MALCADVRDIITKHGGGMLTFFIVLACILLLIGGFLLLRSCEVIGRKPEHIQKRLDALQYKIAIDNQRNQRNQA